jgi:hypothetical protein
MNEEYWEAFDALNRRMAELASQVTGLEERLSRFEQRGEGDTTPTGA